MPWGGLQGCQQDSVLERQNGAEPGPAVHPKPDPAVRSEPDQQPEEEALQSEDLVDLTGMSDEKDEPEEEALQSEEEPKEKKAENGLKDAMSNYFKPTNEKRISKTLKPENCIRANYIGASVSKWFWVPDGDGEAGDDESTWKWQLFDGIVEAYNNQDKWYRIVYTDSDCEDVTLNQLLGLLNSCSADPPAKKPKMNTNSKKRRRKNVYHCKHCRQTRGPNSKCSNCCQVAKC